MKKIVALGAIAALAGGMIFADEPAINTSIAEFSGNAEVKWGMDLDAGQHGFTNSTDSKLKVNLWDGGTKSTEGDDIWAELKIEAKAGAIENGVFKDGAEQKAKITLKEDEKTHKWSGSGEWDATKPEIKEAKIHIGENFYVDIRSGSTQVGEFKPDAAIVADKAWLDNAGVKFENGIQAGYDAEAFKFSLDFRSYKADKTNYTSSYGIAVNGGLKDNLVPGLTVDAGLGVNLSTDYKDCKDPTIEDKVADDVASVDKHAAAIIDWDKSIATDHALPAKMKINGEEVTLKEGRQIAYALKAAYKFALDDSMYVKPSAGFRGSYTTGTAKKETTTNLENELAVGAIFGWGEVNKDANAGVPYLDGDSAKKVSEGVAIVAYIPLPTVSTWKDTKHTEHNALQAMIVPSFYLGESKVEGLKAAAYGEIGILKYIEDKDQPKADGKTTEHYGSTKFENETSAIAFAAGVSYGITLDNDATVTPKAGFRYANSAYVANDLYKKSDVFKALGMQKAAKADDKKTYAADFFNLKLGVDIGGLINNTTFSANYNSANLLNAMDTDSGYKKDTKYYNVKTGTFDIGCKISF